MTATQFFDERTDQSEVKARIIEKYFYAWANVVMGTASTLEGKIAYIDLYAGPGRYKDGSASTPLLVLERAIANPKMATMLVSYFNDANANLTVTLQSEINKLPGIEKLKYTPKVSCGEVDSDAESFFNQTKLVPTLTFVDPFGYKGLSLGIVNGVTKDWGCDCVFFFNYNRINAGLSNEAVRSHINALFGEQRADKLRELIAGQSPARREVLVLEALAQSIKAIGGQGRFVLPFGFKNSMGSRSSHSLVFVSKHFKGYDIMKSIMAAESSTFEQGVPSFSYSPAESDTRLLFSLNTPLDKLEAMLLSEFASETLAMRKIYRRHSVDRPYARKNYVAVLLKLEEQHRIVTNPTSMGRRANTLGDDVSVTFPVCG